MFAGNDQNEGDIILISALGFREITQSSYQIELIIFTGELGI